MIGFIKRLFGPSVDYKKLVDDGAVLLDVRTPKEFEQNSIPNSINIAVDTLGSNLNKIESKDATYIVYCASGMRSAMAKRLLRAKGYKNVHNAGGIQSIFNKIN